MLWLWKNFIQLVRFFWTSFLVDLLCSYKSLLCSYKSLPGTCRPLWLCYIPNWPLWYNDLLLACIAVCDYRNFCFLSYNDLLFACISVCDYWNFFCFLSYNDLLLACTAVCDNWNFCFLSHSDLLLACIAICDNDILLMLTSGSLDHDFQQAAWFNIASFTQI